MCFRCQHHKHFVKKSREIKEFGQKSKTVSLSYFIGLSKKSIANLFNTKLLTWLIGILKRRSLITLFANLAFLISPSYWFMNFSRSRSNFSNVLVVAILVLVLGGSCSSSFVISQNKHGCLPEHEKQHQR